MRSRIRRWGLEAVKVSILALCMLLVQHQLDVVRSQSEQVAHALDEHQGEVDRTRLHIADVVEESQRQLADIQQGLQQSAAYLQSQRQNITRLIASREEQLATSLDDELERYEGALERILDQSHLYDQRIARVEAQVGKVLGRDPGWMERALLHPIVQLKGDGTVGSGVVLYSRPATGAAAEEAEKQEGDGGGDTPHTTFVVTAAHVVMEILGSRFPEGRVERLHILDPERPGLMRQYSAEVEVYDEERDLALLRLDTTEKIDHVARLFPRRQLGSVKLFSRVYAVGCPLGNNPLPSHGEISSKDKQVGSQKFWMINAPTFFGNSGGGVFTADTCELVGISSMIYTYGKSRPVVVPHMGLFVPIDDVVSWLRSEGYGFVVDGAPEPRRAESEPDETATTTQH